MRKLAVTLIIISLMLSMTILPVSAANFTLYADELKAAGLFIGTSKGYELDRAPTRAEAAVMLVRMLGKETEANEKNYSHPFKDVEKWASPYVGYLYKNNLTNGISADKFGSSNVCDAKMFCAFILRSLGYSEAAGDFKYAGVLDFASSVRLIDDGGAYKSRFWRDDCVSIMYNALFMKVKGANTFLWEKLVSEKAVNEAAIKNIVNKESLIQELNAISEKEWKENDGITAYTMKGSSSIKYNASSGSSILGGLSLDISVKMEYSVSVRNKKLESSMIYDMYTVGTTMSAKTYVKDGYMYSDSMGTKTKEKISETPSEELYIYPILSSDSVKSISKKIVGTGIEYKAVFSDEGAKIISGGAFDLFSNMGMGDIGGQSMKNVVVTYTINKDGKIENLNMAMDLTVSGAEARTSMDMKVTATGKDVKIIFPDFFDYAESPKK